MQIIKNKYKINNIKNSKNTPKLLRLFIIYFFLFTFDSLKNFVKILLIIKKNKNEIQNTNIFIIHSNFSGTIHQY